MDHGGKSSSISVVLSVESKPPSELFGHKKQQRIKAVSAVGAKLSSHTGHTQYIRDT
jgi:hypothetical protein